MKHKTMLFQRKEWKIVKHAKNNNGIYELERKAVKDGITHLEKTNIPESQVYEKLMLKVKTHN